MELSFASKIAAVAAKAASNEAVEAAILSTIFIASVSSKRYSLGVDSPSPHRRQKVSIAPAPPPKIPLSILWVPTVLRYTGIVISQYCCWPLGVTPFRRLLECGRFPFRCVEILTTIYLIRLLQLYKHTRRSLLRGLPTESILV